MFLQNGIFKMTHVNARYGQESGFTKIELVEPHPSDPIPNGPWRGFILSQATTCNITPADGPAIDGVAFPAGYNPGYITHCRAVTAGSMWVYR